MPWVRVLADFDWKPKASVTIAYTAGLECNVTRAAAKAMIDVGKAVPLDREKTRSGDDVKA